MAEADSTIKQVKQEADEVLDNVASHPWTERIARFGYATKGAVYIVVGTLATKAALGMGGETTDTRGAMQTIEMQPFGKVLLGIVAVVHVQARRRLGLTATLAQWLIFMGTAKAGASTVAPMTYGQLLMAVVLVWRPWGLFGRPQGLADPVGRVAHLAK